MARRQSSRPQRRCFCRQVSEQLLRACPDCALQWLADHGATHEKISWPSRQTVHGVRGAVARADIEVRVRVPMHGA